MRRLEVVEKLAQLITQKLSEYQHATDLGLRRWHHV